MIACVAQFVLQNAVDPIEDQSFTSSALLDPADMISCDRLSRPHSHDQGLTLTFPFGMLEVSLQQRLETVVVLAVEILLDQAENLKPNLY